MAAKNIVAIALIALCMMTVVAPAASASAVVLHCNIVKVTTTGQNINVPGVGSVTTYSRTICI